MAGFLYKGIVLEQFKEPALSRDLREFFNADTISAQMERDPVDDPQALTPQQIISIARDAHIVDERDGQLLADKLEPFLLKRSHMLVCDAIDDEPYISSQLNPLLKNQKLAAIGLQLLQKVVNTENAFFAVYKNLTDLDVKIPKEIGGFQVKRVRGGYPAEYQASKIFSGESGALVVGAGALLYLARAVLFNKPQTTAFVTVAGNCIGNPTNLEVSIGMTVNQVLERCGLIEDPSRVIIGGSMTGISVIDTEHTLVTATTRAILAFKEDVKVQNFSCIGCSRCVHVCPQGLNPFFLYRSVKLNRYFAFREFDAHMCIGCGTCSYICPAKLDLSETIMYGAEHFRRMAGSMRAMQVQQTKKEKEEMDAYLAQFMEERTLRCQAREEKRAARLAAAAQKAEQAAQKAAQDTEQAAPQSLETAENIQEEAAVQELPQEISQELQTQETVQELHSNISQELSQQASLPSQDKAEQLAEPRLQQIDEELPQKLEELIEKAEEVVSPTENEPEDAEKSSLLGTVTEEVLEVEALTEPSCEEAPASQISPPKKKSLFKGWRRNSDSQSLSEGEEHK